MLFPYASNNPIERKPKVTESIILINMLIFTAGLLTGNVEEMIDLLGYIPDDMNPLKALTSMFMHAGIVHLLFNMWFLYLFGASVENRLGRVKYLLFYLGCGVVSVLIYHLVSGIENSGIPLVGASGAISGIIGAYLILFPFSDFKIFYWFFFFWMGTMDLAALFYIGLWIIVQIALGFITAYTGAQVAFWAHIGGFFFGSILIASTIGMGAFLGEERKTTSASAKGTQDDKKKPFSDIEAIKQELERLLFLKKNNESENLYLRSIKKYPDLLLLAGPQFDLGRMLESRGLESFALRVYEQLIAAYPDAPIAKRAMLTAARLCTILPDKADLGLEYLTTIISSAPSISDMEEAKGYMEVLRKKSEGKRAEIKAEQSPTKPPVVDPIVQKTKKDGVITTSQQVPKVEIPSVIAKPESPDFPISHFPEESIENFFTPLEEKKREEKEKTIYRHCLPSVPHQIQGVLGKLNLKLLPNQNQPLNLKMSIHHLYLISL